MKFISRLLVFAFGLAVSAAAIPAASERPAPQEPLSAILEEDCGDAEDVLAIVNGTEIPRADVRKKISGSWAELESILGRARGRQIELSINGALLSEEARRLGTESTKLLREKVLSQVTAPTDHEALAFYKQNRQKFQTDFVGARKQITDHLLRQRQSAKAGEFAALLRRGAAIEVLVQAKDLSSFEAPSSQVVAKVGNTPILLAEVDQELKVLIAEIREEAYLMQLDAIDQITGDLLIGQEAARRGLAPENTDSMFAAAAVEPENNDRAPSQQHDPDQTREAAKSALLDQLRQSAEIQILLQPPTGPVFDISVQNQPVLGNPNASVTLALFLDYECARCAAVHEIVGRLLQEFDSKLRGVFFEFPLTRHPNAMPAAVAAKAAHDQGKYMEYTALLFKNRSNLDGKKLRELASGAGLDLAAFEEAVTGQSCLGEVLQDRQQGINLGVFSTPTVFINGRRINDKTYPTLKEAIEQALSTPDNRL
jgi:protein-disulfide isomerase